MVSGCFGECDGKRWIFSLICLKFSESAHVDPSLGGGQVLISPHDQQPDATVDTPGLHTVYRFGDFVLHGGRLFRCEETGLRTPVHLGSRALDVLTVLVRRAGELVSKRSIIDAVWPRTVVEDSNLAVQIAALRRILDGGNRDASCIRTITGRGYRFVGPVSVQTSRDQLPGQASVTNVMALTRRLSIIVLPFKWHGDHADDSDMPEALTDALTAELGKLPGAVVIAYEIARWYEAGRDHLRVIREDLRVRYAVEGSVGGLADKLHVSVRLISTESGVQLWADRFEYPRHDPAADQEGIVRRISAMMGVALFRAESLRSQRERPTDPDVLDLVVRAQALWSDQTSLQRCAEAMALFEQALALDPQSLPAIVGLASAMLVLYADRGYWLDGDEPERLAKVISDAQAMAPNDEPVLVLSAVWLERQGHYEASIALARRIIEAHPGNANGYVRLARGKMFCGEADEAIPLLKKAIQLDPYEPQLFDRYQRLGFALLLAGREGEAVTWLERALGARHHSLQQHRYRLLAASYALMGEVTRARLILDELASASTLVTLRCLGYENYRSTAYAAQYARFRHGLRLAGLRDHADEDADFGVAANDALEAPIAGYTPRTAPGAETLGTGALATLLKRHTPLVIDTLGHFWGTSLPNAIGLPNSGVGGRLTDSLQGRLERIMQKLTGGDRSMPIVAVGFNSERFDGRNLAIRLTALDYRNVHWYRGGREAWEVAGLPVTPLVPQAL
jgi:adenylate cyclase